MSGSMYIPNINSTRLVFDNNIICNYLYNIVHVSNTHIHTAQVNELVAVVGKV